MPEGMTPEQAAMATQFAAARQRARREKLAKAGKAIQKAAAKKTEKAGRVSAPAKAGTSLSGGAGGGAAAAAAQLPTMPQMMGAQGAPGAMAGGRVKGGRVQPRPLPRMKAEPRTKQAETGGDVQASRLQRMALGKMQEKIAGAGTAKELQLRKAQYKRAKKVITDIKKLVKASSAASIFTIILLMFSYVKDYFLGNIIYNGDPTGIWAKEEANFFGYKVTPLSFPEVFILLSLALVGWLGMLPSFILPLFILAVVVTAVTVIGNPEIIVPLVEEIGVDFLGPIVAEFGGNLEEFIK